MPGLNPDATWWAESGLHEARKTLRQLQAQIQHYVDTWEVQNDSNSNAMLLIMRPILALVKQARIIIENVKDYIKEHRGGGGKVEVANQAKVAAKVGAVPHIEGQQEQ